MSLAEQAGIFVLIAFVAAPIVGFVVIPMILEIIRERALRNSIARHPAGKGRRSTRSV